MTNKPTADETPDLELGDKTENGPEPKRRTIGMAIGTVEARIDELNMLHCSLDEALKKSRDNCRELENDIRVIDAQVGVLRGVLEDLGEPAGADKGGAL